MSPYTLTTPSHLPGIRKRTIAPTVSLGPTSSKLLIIVAVGLLAVFYISAMTTHGTRYLDLSTLEEERETLLNEKQSLELEASKLRSLPAIESIAPSLQLEPVTRTLYLSGESEVAKGPEQRRY